MEKKFEPRQNELNSRAKELQGLRDQLKTQGDKLNDDARATLVSSIQTKEKSLQRDGDDFNSEVQNAQNEVVQKILKKMGPVILKYAQDNSLALIVDTSNPWPQGPVLWYGPSVDITKAVVDAYNVQSGVPAPAASSTPAAPSASRPATTAPARKPATTTPTAPPK
jgi:outer membrane protein